LDPLIAPPPAVLLPVGAPFRSRPIGAFHFIDVVCIAVVTLFFVFVVVGILTVVVVLIKVGVMVVIVTVQLCRMVYLFRILVRIH